MTFCTVITNGEDCHSTVYLNYFVKVKADHSVYSSMGLLCYLLFVMWDIWIYKSITLSGSTVLKYFTIVKLQVLFLLETRQNISHYFISTLCELWPCWGNGTSVRLRFILVSLLCISFGGSFLTCWLVVLCWSGVVSCLASRCFCWWHSCWIRLRFTPRAQCRVWYDII